MAKDTAERTTGDEPPSLADVAGMTDPAAGSQGTEARGAGAAPGAGVGAGKDKGSGTPGSKRVAGGNLDRAAYEKVTGKKPPVVARENTAQAPPDPKGAEAGKKGKGEEKPGAKKPAASPPPPPPPGPVDRDGHDDEPAGEDLQDEGGESEAQEAKPARLELGSTPQERARTINAIRHLRLDGWTDDDINASDRDRLIRLGEAAQERHQEFHRQRQRARQAEETRRHAARNGHGNGNGADRHRGRADRTDGAEGDGENGATGDRHGDGQDPLDELLDEGRRDDRAADRRDDQDRSRREDADRPRAIPEGRKRDVAYVFGRTLTQLEAEYPQLADSRERQKVVAQVCELDPDRTIAFEGGLGEIEQLVRDAAVVVLGKPKDLAKARAERDAEDRRLSEGTPSYPDSNSGGPPIKVSDDDVDRVTFDVHKAMPQASLQEQRAEIQRRLRARAGKR